MKKRLLCLLLALMLTLSLLPVQVFAYVGGIKAPMTQWAVPVVTKLEGSNQGSQIWSMKVAENGKASGEGIEFYLAIDGPHAGKSVTSSARYHHQASTMDSISMGVYEQARFTLQTGSTQKELKLEKMEVIDPESEPGFENYFGYEVPSAGALTVRCTFSGYGAGDPEVMCYISYHIVKLGDGITNGSVSERELKEDPGESRTYAVVARAAWGAGGVATDNVPDFVLRYYQDFHGFSRMGHANAEANSAHVLLSRSYDELVDDEIIFTAQATDITAGLGRTRVTGRRGEGEVSEIFSDSYGVDNPFVLADYVTVWDANGGLQPTQYMIYDAKTDCLSAEGSTATVGKNGDPYMRTMHVWGLRDVYGKNEGQVEDPKFSEPDKVTIPQDANKLALYAAEGGTVVAALTDDVIAGKFKQLYGEPLYTLRGNFEAKTDANGSKYYEFTDRAAALTSTITATWAAGDHFRVKVDENGLLAGFDVSNMVQYSSPTFKLYWAQDNTVPAPKLVVDDEGVLTLSDIDPEKNSVLVFIDIPQVTSRITDIQLKSDGNIVLTGQMGLDLVFNCDDALINLDALGYGPKKKSDGKIEFSQNGISASGKIDSGSLVGLDLFAIEANINTFDGEEVYDFSLEVNAFDLFETEANLELKRLNNGSLAPNKLYFFLAVQPGIPIAPPVPTSFIRGGGGGFDGLADTINGDYIAIPPIRLKLTVAGDYVKVLKGRAHVTLGPSYLEYAGTDIELAEMDMIDEFKMYLRLTGEKRDYLGRTYTGLRAGGGMGLNLKLPKNNEIFGVDTEVEASMFGGLDDYKDPSWAHLQLDSRGSITATVKVPQRIGKLDFGKLAGKTLASASANFILGGQTAIPVSDGTTISQAAEQAWDNLSIYGGLSHTGNLWKTHWRVYYVIPNHVGGAFHLLKDINSGWSLEDEINKNNWFISGSRTAAQSLTGDEVYLCIDDETGEQIGIAVLENDLFEVEAQDAPALYAVQGTDGRYSETITSPSNPNADNLILQLFPAAGHTVAELRENLKIILPDGSEQTLIDSEVSGSEFTNWQTANCVEISDEDRGAGLLVATDMSAASEQTFTVEADCDFTYVLSASALPTTLDDDLSTVLHPRDGKEYAIRYYFDTERDLSGEHYYLDMDETAPFSIDVPTEGSLAPTGEYYLTAMLLEKVVGDFDGDGEDETSWVTVDTKVSPSTYSYTNTFLPNAPADVTLTATGNETLTASWTAVEGADGYRVTLYYEDGGEWKQAGAPYELLNADFGSTQTPAAAKSGSTLSLRTAPTVHGKDVSTGESYDDAPTNVNYYAAVEAFKTDANASGGEDHLDVRYYSAATKSAPANLPEYTPQAITVTTAGGQSVTLDGKNGYGTLIFRELPGGALFTIDGYDGSFTVEITPDPGTGTFTVSADGDVTADANGKALIERSGRVRLRVTSGNDTTDYYLRLTLDDLAPIVTLDSGNVAADPNTGKYTVAGTTEPGLTVTLDASPALTATADETGRFTMNGTLTKNPGTELTETAGFEALLSSVTAQDAAGNTSDPATVVISARAESKTPVTPSESSGSTGGSKRTDAAEDDPFRDVLESDWFYEDVLFAHSEGLLNGTAKRTFSPYAGTTRAMMATVLWRMDGSPDGKSDSRFTDVTGGQWYSSAVAWADETGIVRGFGDGTFAPNAPITREQFAVMLYRYAQYSGETVETSRSLADFSDADQVSTWAKDAMRWAVSSGVITGKPGKLLDPQGTATRAEIAAMLHRYLRN